MGSPSLRYCAYQNGVDNITRMSTPFSRPYGRVENFVHVFARFRASGKVWTKCSMEKSSLRLDDPLFWLHLPRPHGSDLSTWTNARKLGGTIVGSKSKDDKVGDGATSSEAIPSESAELVSNILRMVAARASSPARALAMEVSSTDMLRDHEERDQLLQDLVVRLMPDDVNPDVWDVWLTGGPAPYDGPGIERVVGRERGLTRPILRSGNVRRNALTRLKEAEAKLEAATKARDAAEAALQKTVITDAALLEYVITDHLLSILQPVFAMGPAWIVMRALSSNVSEKAFADATIMTAEEDLDDARKKIAEERSEVTDRMYETLDLWGGDDEFEEELRESILAVVERYEGKARKGRSVRSQEALRRGIADPDLAIGRREIVKPRKPKG